METKTTKYNDICMKKEEAESSLGLLMREKLELEISQKELSEAYDSLLRRYGSYESEFKNLVMNSEKEFSCHHIFTMMICAIKRS